MLNAATEGAPPSAPPAAAGAEPTTGLRSLKETARFFDVSEPTIQSWLEDGCPFVDKGGQGKAWKLDLRAVKDWLDAREAEQAAARERRAAEDKQLAMELLGGTATTLGGAQASKLSPKDTRDLYQAEQARANIAKMRGELVPASDMQSKLSHTMRFLRDELLQIPDRLGREHGLSTEQVEAIEASVERALVDTSKRLAELSAAPQGNGTDDAA